jgi:two-component system, OmpR family, sensor histidine kinase PhoQ
MKNWHPLLFPPLSTRAEQLYSEIEGRLQRRLLLWLMALTVPFGVVLTIQLLFEVQRQGAPIASFFLHLGNLVGTVLIALYFLWRRRTKDAWVSVLVINLSAILGHSWLLRQPGLILFGLLVMIGPTLVMPLWVTLLLTGIVVLTIGTMSLFAMGGAVVSWIPTTSLFVVVGLGLAGIGIILRRLIAQVAQASVTMEEDASRQGRLEQQVTDLRDQLSRIASLEHDVRQPLRAVQGYLQMLEPEMTSDLAQEMVQPALAATLRAERLINNLLDQLRAEAQQGEGYFQRTQLGALLEGLLPAAQGLARYYTGTPDSISFEIADCLPTMYLARDQVERAVLNLLDNALGCTAPNTTVRLLVWQDGGEVVIEVKDCGPGVPAQVVQAVHEGWAGRSPSPLRLGLTQSCQTAQRHRGRIEIAARSSGSSVQMILPVGDAG